MLYKIEKQETKKMTAIQKATIYAAVAAFVFVLILVSHQVRAEPFAACEEGKTANTVKMDGKLYTFCLGADGDPSAASTATSAVGQDVGVVCENDAKPESRVETTGILNIIFRGSPEIPVVITECSTGVKSFNAEATPPPEGSEGNVELDPQVGGKSLADIPFIKDYLVPAINFLSAGVGIVVVIMIVVGGIQYLTSEGIPDRVQVAKARIRNALIALFLYIFMFAIIQWLIPGGIL